MADQENTYVIDTRLDLSGVARGIQQLRVQLTKGLTSTKSLAVGVDSKGVAELEKKLALVNTQLKKAQGLQGKYTRNQDKMTRATRSTGNALNDVARRVFVWGAFSAAIFGAISNMKELYDVTIQVNTAVAELRKVLPRETDFGALKGEAFSLAIEFGADPLDALKVMKRFAQSGLDAQDSVRATRTALLGMNTTGADTEQIFNALIAANRIFGISMENSGRVIDKIMRLQADFAIDSKDLIASIQGIGPAIKVLGGDIDDLFGNIAALAEAARVSGKEAANSLKRVFSRIVSEEGIRALGGLGITVMKSATEFRSLRDILADLKVALDGASQVQRQNISVVLAQVRQYSKFLALLGNYERAQEAITKSQNAFNDSVRANEDVMDTYAKQTAVASAKMKQFGESVINSGIVQSISEMTIELGQFAAFLSPASGLIAGMIQLGVTVGIAALSIKLLRMVFLSTKTAIGEATAAQGVYAISTGKVTAANIALSRSEALKATRLANFTVVSGIAIAALVALAFTYQHMTRESRRLNRIVEASTKAFKEFQKSIFVNL